MKTTNFVKIDGAKFKELIEGASGKTLKEISLENGFSDAFLRMVVKSGKASPSAQAVAKLYGIEPSAYELKEKPVEDPERVNSDSSTQLSIEDLARYSLNSSITEAIFITGRDEFKTIVKEAVREEALKDSDVKAIVKEAVKELFSDFTTKGLETTYDERTQTYTLAIKVNKEKTYSKPKTATEYLKQLEKDDH